MNPFDQRLDLWVNGWPEMPWLTFFSVAMEFAIIKLLFIVLFVGMLVSSGKTRAAALLTLLAFLIANGLTDLFKHRLPMHRPFQPEALGASVHLRVGWSDSMGTASAHAANMAAVATVLCLMLGRWGYPWIAVAILTGISRIYVGAHYPSQVLLGWACGAFAGSLCVIVYQTIAHAKAEKPPV